ncbi:ice-binding family protein [Patiriisocius sp. Uisw_047]|uniref:DUF7507 domain-containing protein n=1 Tax=Patiriisocius sp. Uisw_047 TaxID=3230969 RepID=UPI0039E7DE21
MKKILLLSLTTIALLLAPNISFGQTPLDLGLLDTYQAFTGVGAVTNHGEVFDGDAGTHNGIISGAGFLASNGYTGTLAQSLSQLAFDAKQNLILLYIHVSDVPVSNTHTPSFGGGETLFPGVYSIGGAGSIAGTLILDGQNDPNAFFIIKLEGALSVDASSSIFLSNGAQAANVYFVAEGPISVGANSVIKGTLMSHPGAVSIGTDCDIEGRLFSSEGAITIGAGTVASKPKGVNNIPVNCVGSCDSIPALDVLGSVKKFALFTSYGSVANAALSGVVGDIGSNNGPVTGIDPSTHLGFKHPSGGLVTAQAAVDLDYAYSQLIAIPNTVLGHAPAFGSGETLFTGVYSIAAAGSLAGTLVLDGNGDPNASFVFKFGGGFSVAAQAKVILKNGARRCNIFWIAEGAISMGTFSVMKGTLLAHDGACTMGANGNLEGRMLSTDGAIGFSTGVIYNDTLCPGNVTPVAHDQAVCSDGSPTQSLTAQATFNAVNGGIQWWDAAIGGNVVQNPTQVGPGTSTYWALYTNGNYQGAARTPVVVTINDCKIAIVKTGLFSDTNNDGCADVGETIDYTFAVTNEGTVSLSDIVVTDPLLAAQNPVVSIDYVSGDNGLTGVVGVLDLTETWIYTASYVLTQNDIDAGVLINQAAVKGAAPKITYPVASVPNTEDVTDLSDHTSVIGDDPTVTTVPQCPVIAIVKKGKLTQNSCAVAGDTIDYTFEVTNEGNVSLSNINVTDPLFIAPNPIVAINYINGDLNADNILDVGENWEYTAIYVMTQNDIITGRVLNQATVEGTQPNLIVISDLSDDNSVLEDDPTETFTCPIAIVKKGELSDGSCAIAGDTIDYTFTVTNRWDNSLSNINVTDPLVPIITYVSGDTNLNSRLDVAEAWIYTGIYTITQNDVIAGMVTNQAMAKGDFNLVQYDDLSDDNSVLENDPTVTYTCPIAIVKEGEINALVGDCAVAGDIINYTFTVTNQSNESLLAINVTDPLVPIITYVSGDTNNDSLLDVTETWIYTGVYTLVQVDIVAGQVTNQATVLGNFVNGVLVTDLSGATINDNDPTVTYTCPIAIVKEGELNVDCAVAGDTITYTFTVTNQSNESLSAINVTDPLVPIITYVSGDTNLDNLLDVTEIWIYTGTYILVQADIVAGQVTNQATVVGNLVNGTLVTDLSGATINDNNPTVTYTCPIAIVKEGELNVDCAVAGDTITYTFTVTNQSNESLSAINVTDPLVPIITYVSGDTNNDSRLDVTEIWIYTGTYTLVPADIVAGQVTNQATVVGNLVNGTLVTDLSGATINDDDPTVTYTCPIAIVKKGELSGGSCAIAGDTITYTFTVTNQSNESLSAINVTDPLVPIITYVSGDSNLDNLLDVTEIWIYTGIYTLVPADIVSGQVTNQATVVGNLVNGTLVTDLSGATINDDDPTVTFTCPIAIVKKGELSGGSCAVAGDTITYTFTVTNQSNESLSSINVTDPLVPIITYVSGDTNNDLLLDVTETWIYTGTYTLIQADIVAGQVTNQATVVGNLVNGTLVSDLSGATINDNDPTVTYTCPIAIVKEGELNVDCAVAGDTITYTFTVTNQSNESLSSINVTDPLVPIITYVSGDTNNDSLLDVTETWIYTGTYTLIQADIVAGQVTNQATVVGNLVNGTLVTDLSGATVNDNDPTVTYTCPIAIVKEGELSDGSCAIVGDTITYTFTVTNQSNESLSAINVTDPLVPIITYVSGDTNNDSLLDVTEIWIYTGTYTLVPADIVSGQVTNQATVVGNLVNGTLVTDLSGATINDNDPTVTYTCPIAIVKEGELNVDCAVTGDTITYTFTVTNQSNESLSSINVTDPLVPIITYVSGDTNNDLLLDVTETWIYTGTYTLVQADMVAGQVTNQAKVEGNLVNGTLVTDLSGATITDNIPTVTYTCFIAIVKEGELNALAGDCAVAGDTITYTFTVTNQGNQILSAINVTDPLVPIITYVSGDTNNDSLLDVTEIWIYTGIYTLVQSDIDAGMVTNQATVLGTAADGTVVSDLSGATINDDDPTVTYTCPIAIVKEGELNGDCAVAGDAITYTFTVTNQSNESLSAINVTDPLVPIITYVLGDTNNDSLLDVTEIWIYTGIYTLVQSDIDAGMVTNQATVVGTAADGTVVSDLSGATINDDDPTVTGMCQISGLSVEKTGVWEDIDGSLSGNEGDMISYTFIITNTGQVTLYDVQIDDPLPGVVVVGGPIAQLDPGETDTTTFTATYTITDADVLEGEFRNQAIGSGYTFTGDLVEDTSDDPNNPTNVDINGDGDPDDVTVTIIPLILGNLEIFNGITPDGDGKNEYFEISGIEDYPNNTMQIFNRWGVLVYETTGYENDEFGNVFKGYSNGRATINNDELLPTGTYFYILNFKGPDLPESLGELIPKSTFTGYLYINR